MTILTKNYQKTKAINNLKINRTGYTKPLDALKEQAQQEDRTALEFCVWFDFSLVPVCNLNKCPFSAILDLIDNGYIINDLRVKPFRLACLLFQKFIQSNNYTNKKQVEEYIIDFPEFIKCEPKETVIKYNHTDLYNYDRVKANKIMFPFFKKNNIDKPLIAELIARELLLFDTKFNNLVFACFDDLDFHGVVKQGIGEKHFMRQEFNDDKMPFMYWKENLEHVSFKEDINEVIFFDTTLHLLQILSIDGIDENVLYCSLHTANANINIIYNVLSKLQTNIKISFNFLDTEQEENYKTKLNLTEFTEFSEVDEIELIPKKEDYDFNKKTLLNLLEINVNNLDISLYDTVMTYLQSANVVSDYRLDDFQNYLKTKDEEFLNDFFIPF